MDKAEKSNAMRLMEKAGLPYEAVTYPSKGEALDAGEVARLLGVPPDSVFKTLVLSGGGGHFVCVIPGDQELDLKKAARHFGVKSLEMSPAAGTDRLRAGRLLAPGHEEALSDRHGRPRGGKAVDSGIRRAHRPADESPSGGSDEGGRHGHGIADPGGRGRGALGRSNGYNVGTAPWKRRRPA